MSDDLLVHSCQLHIWHVLWADCTFTSLLVDFQQWPEGIKLAVFIAVSFIIPLHCMKLATSPSDLSNSNSVLSMLPVLEATIITLGFSDINFKISYCVNMSLIVADIHCTNAQIRLTHVIWLRRTKPVRTAPTANCFSHSGMNRPVLNGPVMNRPVMKRPGIT